MLVFGLVEGGIVFAAVVVDALTSFTPLWVWAFASVGCFAGALIIYRWQSDSGVGLDPKAEERQQRPYTLRTVKEILSDFEGRTEMEAQRIAKQHIGKWLRVDDVVRDVYEFSDEIRVAAGKLRSPTVFLAFEKEPWLVTLETLRVGDRITAEGKINSVSSFSINLADCEVIQLQRPSKTDS